jgi:hypothetical protein
MRTIQLTVPDSDYEAFQRVARAEHRTVEQLLQEALAMFRSERIEGKAPLRDLPVFPGYRPLTGLPSRADLYDEVFETRDSRPQP